VISPREKLIALKGELLILFILIKIQNGYRQIMLLSDLTALPTNRQHAVSS
jgi:hypothetical protein